AQVGGEGEDILVAEFFLHAVELVLRASDQREPRAQRLEFVRGAAAEARAAAGDDDGLALEQAGTEDRTVGHGYSILMLAAFTTSAHFLRSSSMKAATSTGVEPIASTPRSVNFALIARSRMILASV